MNVNLIQEIVSKQILHLNAREYEEFPPELRGYGQHILEIYFKWNQLSVLVSFSSSILYYLNHVAAE